MGGTRDRIFKNGGLGGEEPGDEVDVLAWGRDDDASGAQIDPVEQGSIDGQGLHLALVSVDEHVVPRFVNLLRLQVQRFFDFHGKDRRLGCAVGQCHLVALGFSSHDQLA